MPWLSVTIWSQTAASSGPYTLSSSSARASLSPSPWTGSSGSPARTSSPMPLRAAHTSAIRSASRRRRDETEDLRRGAGRATARRRRCRRAAAARRPRRTASARRARPGTGPAGDRCSGRTPWRALPVAGRAAGRGDPASVRRADGGRCRPAPSPTRRRRPSRRASRRPAPTDNAAARSCRRPPRPARR